MRRLVLLLLLLLAGAPAALAAPPLGADLISPASPQWETHRARFREMRGEAARFRISPGFGGSPSQVEQLIGDGARVVVLTTEDCDWTVSRVRQDLIDRGYLAVIDRHPEVSWWLELGNEPNLCGLGAGAARAMTLALVRELGWLRDHGLRIAPSMPTALADVRAYLADDVIERAVDGIAVHVYAWFDPATDAGGGDWPAILDTVLTTTDRPVLVTEIGIDDRGMPKTEKAERILDYVDGLPDRVVAVTLFAITDTTDRRWPQYTIDAPMAAVLAARDRAPAPAGDCRWFPETGHWLCHGFRAYWERFGGLAIFGYPISDEFVERGVVVQYFERARFEWHPGAWPERYDVLLGRLGAEVYQQRAENAR